MIEHSKICATEACFSTNRSKLLGSTTDNVSCIPFITYTCKTQKMLKIPVLAVTDWTVPEFFTRAIHIHLLTNFQHTVSIC